jgi:hypothetical protein
MVLAPIQAAEMQSSYSDALAARMCVSLVGASGTYSKLAKSSIRIGSFKEVSSGLVILGFNQERRPIMELIATQ